MDFGIAGVAVITVICYLAGQLVKAAERCSSRVEIIYDYSIINARSLLNILSAAIPNGADIELRCTGPDEKEDLEMMTEAMKHLE